MVQPSRLISIVTGCIALAFTLLTAIVSTNFDFHAFYCAGHAAADHANPYHLEPLRTCERTAAASAFGGFFDKVTLPAPQPGYDIALFAALSRFGYGVAARLWTILLLLASMGTVLVLHRVTRVPATPVFVALWLSLCLPSIYLGEIVPLCLLAIAAAAQFAQTSRFALAGVAAAATLVEPHIGVPICLSALLWMPRSRFALVSSACVLAAISFLVLGARQNLEYLTAVLPMHALSELTSDAQLSLSTILHAAGMSPTAALRSGTIAFLAATVAGVLFGRVAARRFGDQAFILAVPSAFSVAGGVFMHVTEIVAAIPLALLLVRYAPAHGRVPAAALILLAVPWWSLATPMLFGTSVGVVLAGITVFYLLWCFAPKHVAGAAIAAVCGAVALTAVLHWHDVTAVHDSIAYAPAATWRAPYPEASWKWFNDRYMSTASAASWLLRAGSWSGLILLLAALRLCLTSFRAAPTETVCADARTQQVAHA